LLEAGLLLCDMILLKPFLYSPFKN
jgi:hypothetical protein